MKTETLKKLIQNVFDKTDDKEKIYNEIMTLITLYELDELDEPEPKFLNNAFPYKTFENPYYINCMCNPLNGGDGICNCTKGGEYYSTSTI
jgi:hypothetical protein